MSDWIDEIKSHVETYAGEKTKVTTALNSVLGELKYSTLGYGYSVELTNLAPLLWTIAISITNVGRITFEIEYDDILAEGGSQNVIGDFIPGFPEDLEGALRNLITKKVKSTLVYKRD
ncbi:hypothetical protein [Paenibacillus tianjinensis]|uniref:Uncharacterized protein n=1 Tax=Paenibacillus tianjinensis TaxID=2810347 RepID=A0ABX7L7P9_9BACL|nr:hypothetical protein [Paenibacillus tianjinensis]QSF42674.1 hypothetical protein JRJ22_15260 [Paenibacillus tianjinensis]